MYTVDTGHSNCETPHDPEKSCHSKGFEIMGNVLLIAEWKKQAGKKTCSWIQLGVAFEPCQQEILPLDGKPNFTLCAKFKIVRHSK